VNSLAPNLKQKQKAQGSSSSVANRCRVVLFNYHMEKFMSKITSAVKAFIADENGVTAIEYGLIASLIGVAMVTAAGLLGTKLDSVFTFVTGKLKDA
jgi:pilus assembly protein Flp/PilA